MLPHGHFCPTLEQAAYFQLWPILQPKYFWRKLKRMSRQREVVSWLRQLQVKWSISILLHSTGEDCVHLVFSVSVIRQWDFFFFFKVFSNTGNDRDFWNSLSVEILKTQLGKSSSNLILVGLAGLDHLQRFIPLNYFRTLWNALADLSQCQNLIHKKQECMVMLKLYLPAYKQQVTLPGVYLITTMVRSTVQIIYFFQVVLYWLFLPP